MCQSVDRLFDIIASVWMPAAVVATSGIALLVFTFLAAREGTDVDAAAPQYEREPPQASGPRALIALGVSVIAVALAPLSLALTVSPAVTSHLAWAAAMSAGAAAISLPVLWLTTRRHPARPRTLAALVLGIGALAAAASVWPLQKAGVLDALAISVSQILPVYGMAAALSAQSKCTLRWSSGRQQLGSLPAATVTAVVFGALLGFLVPPVINSAYGTKAVAAAAWMMGVCGGFGAPLALGLGLVSAWIGRRAARTLFGPFLNDLALMVAGLGFFGVLVGTAWCGSCKDWETIATARPLVTLLTAVTLGALAAWALARSLATGMWGWFARKPPNSESVRLTTHPIDHPHHDLLGRWQLAGYLADRIRNTRSKGGVVLLAGEFGSGKTSVLNLARFILAPDRTARFLTLSAQTVDSGNRLLLDSLERIAADLGKFNGRWSTRRLFRRYAYFLSLLPQGNSITEFLRGLLAFGDVHQMRKRLVAGMRRAGLTYTLAIEDLDRLPPETVRTVLRGLQPIFDIEGVVVVIAGDMNIFSESLSGSST